MKVRDFVFFCEFKVKICDYVSEEILFSSDDVNDEYGVIMNSELGQREVAFASALMDCIYVFVY